MISLFLDTSSHKIIVGIYQDTEEIILNIEENDNRLSERILPLLDSTLKQASKQVSDLDHIFVVNGPGSFTGTRIGVTVAKMLAWSGNIQISTISELEVIAGYPNNVYSVPMIDARRGYMYTGMYDNTGKNIIKDQYIEINSFLEKLESYRDVQLVSYDKFDIDNLKEPILNISQIIARHINDSGVNPHSVRPNYLKLTEAEERLNDQGNKE